jgi:hypothetical protein
MSARHCEGALRMSGDMTVRHVSEGDLIAISARPRTCGGGLILELMNARSSGPAYRVARSSEIVRCGSIPDELRLVVLEPIDKGPELNEAENRWPFEAPKGHCELMRSPCACCGIDPSCPATRLVPSDRRAHRTHRWSWRKVWRGPDNQNGKVRGQARESVEDTVSPTFQRIEPAAACGNRVADFRQRGSLFPSILSVKENPRCSCSLCLPAVS